MRARRVAIAVGILIVATGLAGVLLIVYGRVTHPHVALNDYWKENLTNAVAFGFVSVLLLLKRPDNRVTWIFAALSVAGCVQLAAGQYGALSLRGGLRWPAAAEAAWLSEVAQTTAVMMLLLLFLYFPTGRVVSPRWWPVEALLVVAVIAQIAFSAVEPGPLELLPRLSNPFGISAPSIIDALGVVANLGASLGTTGAIVALGVRFWRSRGVERQQLKWFVYAAVVAVTLLFASSLVVPEFTEGPAGNWMWAILPASVGVAAAVSVLRYRLYDIDLVINRTLVYAALTAILVTCYVGLVFGFQAALQPFTAESDVAVAASTLAVAALFRPLRTRVQTFIDHRFYRRKFDAQQTLDEFSAGLRDELDLASLSRHLQQVITETIQPAHVSLWLRERA